MSLDLFTKNGIPCKVPELDDEDSTPKFNVFNEAKNAKIFYSVINKKVSDEDLDIAINKKQKAFKKFLGPELHLRTTPKIKFIKDNFFFHQEKLAHLMSRFSNDEPSDDFKP